MKLPRVPLKCMPLRYLVCLECFFGLTINYVLRTCFNIAIISMAGSVKRDKNSTDVDPNGCPIPNNVVESNKNMIDDFHWDSDQHGWVLSSMFIGYLFFMIPAGILSDKYGAVPLIIGGTALSIVCTAVTPVFAGISWILLCAIRAILGLGQAIVYAPLHCIVAAWVPPKERGTWSSVIFSGAHAGSFLNGIITGNMLAVMNWRYSFYIWAVVATMWLVTYILFASYNSPSDCSFLSEKEKRTFEEAGMESPKHRSPPWMEILLNPPVWAVVVGMVGHDYGVFMLVTELPKFLHSALHFNIASNGYLNAGLYLCIWAVGNMSGPLADYVDRKKLIPRIVNRKIGTTIASLLPSIGLLASVYTNCDTNLALVALYVGCSFIGFFYSSLKVSPIDIAPEFSGIIGAGSQTAGAAAGAVVPKVVGAVARNEYLSEWRWVMWINFIIMSVTNVFYIVFASASPQAFNGPEYARKLREERINEKTAKETNKKAGKKSETAAPDVSNAGTEADT